MSAEAIAAPGLQNASDDASKTSPASSLSSRELAQATWVATSVRTRLAVIQQARHLLATHAEELAAAIASNLARTPADTIAAEVLPLLEACRFLERNAARLLRSRNLGSAGRPLWLGGLDTELRRLPWGHVLVIGPSNYPLFLPGVQVLQALVAGNAVTWKPGHGGRSIAVLCAHILAKAGLPRHLLSVTEDTIHATVDALHSRPDKVIFTGSAAVGRLLLHQFAETATPSVMELSGCDAVLVLPSADLDRVANAVSFGMRLNGSATCMAPRRLILVGLSPQQRAHLLQRVQAQFASVPATTVSPATADQLSDLLTDVVRRGGHVIGEHSSCTLQPLLILNGHPDMAIAQADLFAPVLTVLETTTLDEALALEARAPLALTLSIFTADRQIAKKAAARLTTATVLVNDLIAPTADPRLPFGGRGASGFGVTRGAEGLLEMTRTQVVTVQRSRSKRHYEPTDARHTALFAGLTAALHGGSLATRWRGIQRTVGAARSLRPQS